MKNNHILKFRKIDKFLIDSLVHSHIYFAPPDKLNDPFDCRIDIEKSLTKAISQSSDLGIKILGLFKHKEIQELINQAQKEIIMYGIFSGSHSPALNSSLMWSHYADSHRGVCLIYAIPTEPEEFYKPNQILGIQNVKYGINILTEWFKELPSNESIHKEAFSEMFRTMLTIKDKCWHYEDEVRMIRKTFGIVPINKSYLQHVCFGLDIAESEIRLIKEIIEKFNYDVHFSRIQRTQDDFGIRAVDIV